MRRSDDVRHLSRLRTREMAGGAAAGQRRGGRDTELDGQRAQAKQPAELPDLADRSAGWPSRPPAEIAIVR